MGKVTRKRYAAEFEAKVALDAIEGELTLAELAATWRSPDATPATPGDLVITRPNQVWCADITYIPMRRGFLYLVAIMDWATRRVLAWRLSNTMEAEFASAWMAAAAGWTMSSSSGCGGR